MALLHISENLCTFPVRASYATDAQGVRHLLKVQQFGRPVFRSSGIEREGWQKVESIDGQERPKGEPDGDALVRAQRRARREVFDLAICNPCLDTFVTLTVAPREGFDRTDYDEVYGRLRPWLSNRVQRRGLRYVAVPERHKAGGIHLHALCNRDALDLTPAINPHTGRGIVDRGRIVYNVTDWAEVGFSTAKLLGDGWEDRIAVAKYVTKYMTKEAGRIGGRYFLHGGKLALPEYEYFSEIPAGIPPAVNEWSVDIPGSGVYRELGFL